MSIFPIRFYIKLQAILSSPPNESEIQQKNIEFQEIYSSLKVIQSRHIQVEKLKLRINMIQTLLERIPLCSMQLALMFSSLEYKRLLLALPNMGYVFEDYSVVFVITSALTFFGITNTLLQAK